MSQNRGPRILGGQYRGRPLAVPPGRVTRPARARLRRSLFDSLQAEIPGSSWLDLFAGSGSFGIEALSRGARTATFVENASVGVRCLRRNFTELGIPEHQCHLLRRRIPELFAGPRPESGPFDLVSLDPPFAVSRDGDQLQAMVAGLQAAEQAGWFSDDALLAWEEPSNSSEPSIPGFRHTDTRPFGSSRLRLFRHEV